jgi:hypothetical protein
MDKKLGCKVRKLFWRFRWGDQGIADVPIRSQELNQKLRCKVTRLGARLRNSPGGLGKETKEP